MAEKFFNIIFKQELLRKGQDMVDRLAVEKVQLDNGITIYLKLTDDPFFIAGVSFPVGHCHNAGEIGPGSFHFLEHMVANRSKSHPAFKEYVVSVGLQGGVVNCSTGYFDTNYVVLAPSAIFPETFAGFMSQVYEPLFLENDLVGETSIIANERKKAGKWAPAKNELNYRVDVEWRSFFSATIRQRLGDNEDLETITVPRLRELHRAYFDPKTVAIVAGGFDRKLVLERFSSIPTQPHNLPVKYTQRGWAHREYFESDVQDIERFLYHFGGILDTADPQVHMANLFIGTMLINTVHGTLYGWLRDNLKWCYNMGFDRSLPYGPLHSTWELWFPLNNAEQVEMVRRELRFRVEDVIADEALIQSEVARQKATTVFSFQTLESVAKELAQMLDAFGRTFTEAERLAFLDNCRDRKLLREIYDQFWSPEVVGEFLAVPAGRK